VAVRKPEFAELALEVELGLLRVAFLLEVPGQLLLVLEHGAARLTREVLGGLLMKLLKPEVRTVLQGTKL
jgi:hypothetical protein